MRTRDRGFTLIELLVVIVIIAILAGIAIPVFLAQRQRGWRAQAVSDMKNAATAVESYATDHGGSYVGLDGADETSVLLRDEGFRPGSLVEVDVVTTASTYCIRGRHAHLSDDFVLRNAEGVVKRGAPGFSPC
jgi:type IV pilus assembly protein PilA